MMDTVEIADLERLPASPMVSVAMITYNQERFIAQAIESVLMQETDFPVELVIGEDCSTDGTRAIVQKYAQRHPDRIRLLLHERNLGLMGKNNFVAVYKACRGKYVALLEGDDYWTDPHKLQKQVEFLEAHPECSMCFHAVRMDNGKPEGHTAIRYPEGRKRVYTLQDWLISPIPHTASLMLRNGLIEFPDWFFSVTNGDWALNIIYAQHGDAGYIDEVMSVYRMHGRGVWTELDRIKQLQQLIRFREDIARHLDPGCQTILDEAAALDRLEMATEFYLAGQQNDAHINLHQAIDLDSVDNSRWKARVLAKAWEVEAAYDFATSEKMLHWLSSALSHDIEWTHLMRDVRSEWYLAHTFKADAANDAHGVRRFAWAAFRNDWRVFKNRGLKSVFVRAAVGDRCWNTGRSAIRFFQSADSRRYL